jgi:hypothetical protein
MYLHSSFSNPPHPSPIVPTTQSRVLGSWFQTTNPPRHFIIFVGHRLHASLWCSQKSEFLPLVPHALGAALPLLGWLWHCQVPMFIRFFGVHKWEWHMTIFGKDCSDQGLQPSEMPPAITLRSCLIGLCVGSPLCYLMYTVPIAVGYALTIIFNSVLFHPVTQDAGGIQVHLSKRTLVYLISQSVGHLSPSFKTLSHCTQWQWECWT